MGIGNDATRNCTGRGATHLALTLGRSAHRTARWVTQSSPGLARVHCAAGRRGSQHTILTVMPGPDCLDCQGVVASGPLQACACRCHLCHSQNGRCCRVTVLCSLVRSPGIVTGVVPRVEPARGALRLDGEIRSSFLCLSSGRYASLIGYLRFSHHMRRTVVMRQPPAPPTCLARSDVSEKKWPQSCGP